MNIRNIIKEEMDWISDIEAAIPDKNVLNQIVTVDISVYDYLNAKYNYNFINIILTNNKIIEIQMDGSEVIYSIHDSIYDLVHDQGLVNDINENVSLDEYLREFNLRPVSKEVEGVIKKIIPLDMVGIYVANM